MTVLSCPRFAAVVAACFLISPSSLGNTASPWPYEEVQPDGSRVVLRLQGDEHVQWETDDEGFTVVRQEGWTVYAERGADGRLTPTRHRVGRINPRALNLPRQLRPQQTSALKAAGGIAPLAEPSGLTASATAAKVGTYPNLVVLLRFSNHATRTLPGRSDYDILMNAVGGHPTIAPTGSVRDAYLQNSYGRLQLNSTVVAWITLPNTEAYYSDGQKGLTTKIHEALKYALNTLDADPTFSFLPFDQNQDGAIDAITFIHSGYAAEWGGTSADGANYLNRIWSHKWSISGGWVGSDNVRVSAYHINPGLWGTSGSSIGRIGVICHETGHFFGLPDLYDGGDSDGDGKAGEGLGSYCLMANSWGFDGSQRYPPQMCAWAKIYLGWITPTTITGPGSYLVRQQTQYPDTWRLNLGYPSGEYLLIENRQRHGTDGALPQGGLAIYHVDESASTTYEGHPWQSGWPRNNRHYRVALLPADGLYELERGLDRGDGGDVFRSGGVSQLNPSGPGVTHPNTDAYKGGIVVTNGNRIFNISAPGPSMTFQFEVVSPGTLPSAPTTLAATATSSTQIILTWSDTASNESGFSIARSLDNVAFAVAGTVGINVTSFTDTGRVANTTYWYRVRAVNGSGNSSYSNVASARTGGGAPSTPVGLRLTPLAVTSSTPPRRSSTALR